MEHYYQATKANCKSVHDYLLNAPHARLVMVFGRQLERSKYLEPYMKKHWDLIKLRVMLTGLRKKFDNPRLRKMLLDTGESILQENNDEDPFWGVGDGSGSSWLGKLLMVVREEKRRGWICQDFQFMRCAGDSDQRRHDACPEIMCDICFEMTEYGVRHEP